MKDFFISYNKADRAWAEWIAWQLEHVGYNTVLQAWDFAPGGNFILEMQKAAQEAARKIAVLSPDYLKSEFTQPEWAVAFREDPLGRKRLLIPVLVRACELEGLLANIIYVDLVGRDEAFCSAALLKAVEGDRAKPAMPPIFPGVPAASLEKPWFPGAASPTKIPGSAAPSGERLMSLFRAALQRRPEERDVFIAEACGEDAGLRNQVSALVRAHTKETVWRDENRKIDAGADGYAASLSLGRVLQRRFRILRFLGHGGMGEVYEAQDLELGCRIALKTIRPEIADNPYTLARFRQEVNLARKVSGPNVCRIHELFPKDDNTGSPAFLTMEFLEGRTLAEHIKDGCLPQREAKLIAAQLCSGLRTIHDARVIHRDFKTRNAMLAERNGTVQAVLMDFGLARDAAASAAAAGSGVSVVGSVVGTPPYMAPEQLEGRQVSPATDIFALGVVLYEMVTGKRPFAGETFEEAAAERTKRPNLASSLRPGLSPRWDQVIDRCLQYEPKQRYQTAIEVAETLNRPLWLVKLVRRVAPFKSKGTFGVLIPTLVVLVALIVGVLYWLRAHPSAPSPDAQRWYEEGTAALREGTYLKATLALGRAVQLDGNYVLAHARLADAWNELDFTAKAKDEMLRAGSIVSAGRLSNFEQHYVEAVRDTIVPDFPAAVEQYEFIFRALPDSMKAYGYVDLGRAYEKAGKIDDAIRSYLEAAKRAPEYPASFVRLGILETREKHTIDADAAFAHAESLYRAASNLEGIAEIDYQKGYAANTQGELGKAREFLQKSLLAAQAIPSVQLEVRAQGRLSTTECLSGNVEKSIELAKQAIQLAQKNGIEYWQTDGLIRLASAYLAQTDYDKAESTVNEALRRAQASQQPRLEALARLTVASIRERQGRTGEVIPFAQSALDYYKKQGFFTESTDALALILRAKQDEGDLRNALESSLQLLEVAKKWRNPASIMRAEETLGSVLLGLEQYPRALDHYQGALAVSRTLGQQVEYYAILCSEVLWRLGRYVEAEEMLDSISPTHRNVPEISFQIDRIHAQMRLSQKRYGQALNLVRGALRRANLESSSSVVELKTLEGLAQSHLSAGRDAERVCQEALNEAQREGNRQDIANASLALADVYASEGLAQNAKPLAQKAHAFFASSEQKESEWRSLLCLSRIEMKLGDSTTSRTLAAKAIDIFSEFEHNWPASAYQTYLSRPDIQGDWLHLSTLKGGGRR